MLTARTPWLRPMLLQVHPSNWLPKSRFRLSLRPAPRPSRIRKPKLLRPASSPQHLAMPLRITGSRALMLLAVRKAQKVTLASPVTSRVAKKLPATMIPTRSSPIARPKSPMLRSCSSLATSLSACWPTPVLQSPVLRRSLRQTPLRLRTTVRVPRSSGTVAMAYSPNGRKAPITAH